MSGYPLTSLLQTRHGSNPAAKSAFVRNRNLALYGTEEVPNPHNPVIPEAPPPEKKPWNKMSMAEKAEYRAEKLRREQEDLQPTATLDPGVDKTEPVKTTPTFPGEEVITVK
jgi:hypothetical protein